jgi:arginase family enzyme
LPRVAALGLDVRVLDVDTVSPPHDAAGMTAFLAATVMWTFLAAFAAKQSRIEAESPARQP